MKTKLKQIREERKITRKELSKKSSISERTIGELEQGRNKIRNARTHISVALADALECDIHEIIDIEEV